VVETEGVRFGQYQLVKRIARGGMAEIFLAIEHKIEGVKRQVVVKRVLPQMLESDDFITMFMDEARVAARLSHPNIAHVYNFGQVGGIYFLAMEFVDGLTVSKIARLMPDQRVPLDMTLRIVADACAGLHHAHELCDEKGKRLGVVHRDVSPQNIMVSRTGVAKLLDFGVAHASTQVHHTAVGQLKGKLAYMSPEQFRGDAVDRRADVFAAGVVLFEMLTGTPLFRRENEAATMHALIYEDPPSLVPFGAPPQLDSIVQRACRKDVGERYQTMEELQEDIETLAVTSGRVVTSKMLGRFVEEGMERVAETKQAIKIEKPIPDVTPSNINVAKGVAGPPRHVSGAHAPPPLPHIPPPPPTAHAPPPVPPAGLVPRPPPMPRPTPPEIPSGRASSPSARPLMATPDGGQTPMTATGAVSRDSGRRTLVGIIVALVVLILIGGGLALWQVLKEPVEARLASLTSRAQEGNVPDATKTVPVDRADSGPAATVATDSGTAGPHTKVESTDAGATPADGGAAPATSDGSPGAGETGPQEERRRYGELYLNTTPWCDVRLGGRSLGTTPIVGARVPEGSHTLRLIDAEGRTHSRRVQIKAGQPTKLFINLRGEQQ